MRLSSRPSIHLPRLHGLLDSADQGREAGLGSVVPLHQYEIMLFLKLDRLGFSARALDGVERICARFIPANPDFGGTLPGVIGFPAFRRSVRGNTGWKRRFVER